MLGHTTFGRTATATWQARAEKMRLELNQLEAVGGETNKRYQNEAFANLGSPFNEPVRKLQMQKISLYSSTIILD